MRSSHHRVELGLDYVINLDSLLKCPVGWPGHPLEDRIYVCYNFSSTDCNTLLNAINLKKKFNWEFTIATNDLHLMAMQALWAESFKSELAKISELRKQKLGC